MITAAWTWLKSFFTAKRVGILVAMFVSKTASPLIADILDKKIQKKAYDFVVELNRRQDMTKKEKMDAFNKKMKEWLQCEGKKMHESAINFLRELAVNAIKANSDDKEDQESQS